MTTLSRHLDDEQAQRLVDGSLARDEALALERHAAACAECRASVETYRMLAGALDALDVPEVPADFTAGVLSRIDARERAAARERRWAVGIVATMLAATVAVFAAAGPGAWAPALSSAAEALGGAARAFRIGGSFVPAVVGALRFQIVAAAALLALPLVIALARLVPAPRAEIV
jgi:anti-sigma factor RsiW